MSSLGSNLSDLYITPKRVKAMLNSLLVIAKQVKKILLTQFNQLKELIKIQNCTQQTVQINLNEEMKMIY